MLNNNDYTTAGVAFDYLESQQYTQTPSMDSLHTNAMPELASQYTTTMRKKQ
jgi:hypothetical protein